MKCLLAFLGGAAVGASLALLFAPESGDELREHIREALRRQGLFKQAEEEEVVEQILAEIRESE